MQPHSDRRRRLLEHHSGGVVLVRGAGPEGTNPNFVYLTGIDEPQAALLLADAELRIGTGRANPGVDYVRGRSVRQVLFLPRTDPVLAQWGEQGRHTAGSVDPGRVGVDAVLALDQLESALQAALKATGRVHYVRGHAPKLTGADDPDTALVAKIRRRFFDVECVDATPTVHAMRRLKDDGEIRAVERSIAITAEALARVAAEARPGRFEYEIEAEITRVYRSHGGGHAFEPIVAGGQNALKLHYRDNADRIEPDQLLLVDTGAAVDHYRSDITRTLPVSGRFTTRQREVYETVLAAQAEAIAICRPGGLLADVHASAFQVIDGAGFGASFMHGTGHHLGMETHDVGDIHAPLEPGAIVTVEPGIYLGDEGIGVRIEDDVLVTPDGPRVLSAAIPKSVEDVERLMSGEA